MNRSYRRIMVSYFREGYDIDRENLLHVRIGGQWYWSYDHIPMSERAQMTVRERDTIRRNLANAPRPEVTQ